MCHFDLPTPVVRMWNIFNLTNSKLCLSFVDR